MEYLLSKDEAIKCMKNLNERLCSGTYIVIGYSEGDTYHSTKFKMYHINVDIDLENFEMNFSMNYNYSHDDLIVLNENIDVCYNHILKCFEISKYPHYDFFFEEWQMHYALTQETLVKLDDVINNAEKEKKKVIDGYNKDYGNLKRI